MHWSWSILCALVGVDFFFSSRRRHTRLQGDWSSDVCSSDLMDGAAPLFQLALQRLAYRDQRVGAGNELSFHFTQGRLIEPGPDGEIVHAVRSEERRVGKECRSRWSPYH